MSLTHRLQLLLDEEQYQRLLSRSEAEGRSMGAIVREAIDLVWVDADTRKRSAAEAILAASPMPVPEPEDLRVELDDARAGRFS